MLRTLAIAALAGMLLLASGASATGPAVPATQAVAVRILVPGRPAVESAANEAFSYPADGSVVQTESTSSVVAGNAASAGASALSVFGGDIRVDTLTADLASGGDVYGSSVAGLVVLGQAVFSVGWEKVGGRRLWLRDDRGNYFYYAHLSAYSPLAVNGAIVNAGDVLGFVGDSGDAEGTPFHLHFEVHPVGLLDRGYDGAVNPTSYLREWRHPKYLRFEAGAGWTPTVLSERAPKDGAVLLRVSLDRALAAS